jgi:uncharacterized protein (DUF433 family)
MCYNQLSVKITANHRVIMQKNNQAQMQEIIQFQTPTAPLLQDNDGTIRVGGTRVRLDTVLYAFNEGYTAEEIVSQFPTLTLAHVYSTIAYYLNNRALVDDYLRQGEEEAARLKREIETQPGYKAFREQLLARRQERLSQQAQ